MRQRDAVWVQRRREMTDQDIRDVCDRAWNVIDEGIRFRFFLFFVEMEYP